MLSKRHKNSIVWQKYQAMLSVVILAVALFAVPAFAWLSYNKSLETQTLINRPNALVIGAGDGRAISELELSDIDTSGVNRYKDIVFCVYSDYNIKYRLQLAHTTNIGFTYSMFPAVMGDGGNTIISYLEKNYSFDKTNPLPGQYMNLDTTTTLGQIALSEGRFHEITYPAYNTSKVQTYAEPLYWQSSYDQSFPEQKDEKLGDYINYYVLRIEWGEETWNNKETDMVYIMAEAVSE